MQKTETNEVLDNVDFQQEKREEVIEEIEDGLECCSLCGKTLSSSELVYRLPDGKLAHTRCVLYKIDEESREYGDILSESRYTKSTEEIF